VILSGHLQHDTEDCRPRADIFRKMPEIKRLKQAGWRQGGSSAITCVGQNGASSAPHVSALDAARNAGLSGD